MNFDKKSFLGKLNSDIDERLFSAGNFRGDYSDAYNVLVLSAIDSGIGLVKGFKGTTEVSIPYDYSSTSRKIIGRHADIQTRKIYFFIAHSTLPSSNDGIYELDVFSKTVIEVIKGSFLKLNNTMRITGINIVDGKYLLYTDGVNTPRNIDIVRAKNGELTTERQILAIKQPPLSQPKDLTTLTDFTFVGNNIRGNFFQFKYRYVYKDNTRSTFSPISSISKMGDEFFPETEDSAPFNSNNALSFIYNIPSSDIIALEFAVRAGNTGDFGLFDTIDLFDQYKKVGIKVVGDSIGDSITFTSGAFSYTATSSSASPSAAMLELYNLLIANNVDDYADVFYDSDLGYITISSNQPNSNFTLTSSDESIINTLLISTIAAVGDNSYLFKNDRVLIPIDVRESNLEYDRIPIKALAQECVNGSNIIYGGITEGYDSPIVDMKVGVEYQTYSYANMTGVNTFLEHDIINGKKYAFWDVYFTGTITGGMLFKVDVVARSPDSIGAPSNYFSASYTSTNSDTIVSVYNKLAAQLNLPLWLQAVVITSGSGVVPRMLLIINVLDAISVPSPSIVTANNPFSPNMLVDGLKNGDSYSYGIVYLDDSGRTSTVGTNGACQVSVPFLPELGIPTAVLTVNSRPPDWATKFQIVRTKRKTVNFFIQFTVPEVGVNGDNSNLLDYNFSNALSNLAAYNSLYGTALSYTWQKGDRLRFIKYRTGEYFPVHEDLPILSIREDGALQTPRPVSFPTGSAPDLAKLEGVIVEVYRPNTFTSVSEENDLYFEVAVSGTIGNAGLPTRYHIPSGAGDQAQTSNLSQPMILYCKEGDVWYKTTRLLDRDDVPQGIDVLESLYQSDKYTVETTNIGRANAYDRNAKQVFRKATMYHTEAYREQSDVNDINRVYPTSFKDYTQSFGAIKLLYLDGFMLHVFQETKVGRVPVSRQMVYNQDNTSSLILSSTILNDCVYFDYIGGINNNPESFCFNQFNKYFVDIENNAVCKIGGNGIIRISDIGMVSHFTEVFTKYKKTNPALASGQTPRFYGAWDEDNKLVIFAPETIIENPEDPILTAADTIAYSETQNGWSTKIDFKPSAIIGAFGELFSWSPNTGKLWTHNTNDVRNLFYGVQRTRSIEVPSCLDPNASQSFLSLIQEPAMLPDDRFDSVEPGSAADPSIWNVPVITTALGQESNLLAEDFEKKEGLYFAGFYRDTTTPVTNPLLEGDALKGVWIKLKLTNSSPKDIGLNSILIGCVLSKRTGA